VSSPLDVHVQVLPGKIDSNDVLTDVTVQDLDLAGSYGRGRYRFDRPIVVNHGGAFGYTVRVGPRNDLLTSAAELGVVAVA
jgi:starch phosphorylase